MALTGPLGIGRLRRRLALHHRLNAYHAEIERLAARATVAEETIAATREALAEMRRITNVSTIAREEE
jgi:hypothetical protein